MRIARNARDEANIVSSPPPLLHSAAGGGSLWQRNEMFHCETDQLNGLLFQSYLIRSTYHRAKSRNRERRIDHEEPIGKYVPEPKMLLDRPLGQFIL